MYVYVYNYIYVKLCDLSFPFNNILWPSLHIDIHIYFIS